LELVALQGEISELRRDNETFKARLTESLDELRKKDGVISQLEARTAKLVQQNDEQSKLIDNLVF
jgi:septal ring factor EnvC (AmiA/AmiB activator)